MKRLAMLLAFLSSVALAQTTPGPATYVQIRTAPTVGAACTANQTVWVAATRRTYCCPSGVWAACDAPADCAANPPVGACDSGQTCVRTDTGALYVCQSSAWVASAPASSGASGIGQASNGTGGFIAIDEFTYSSGTDSITTAYSYEQIDANGDGTVDARRCGDYDNDGTLELTDVELCVETNQANGMTFVIASGTYTGGFKTTVNITADNVVVRGMGDATKLVISAPCSGSADAVSDNDGTADVSQLFLIASGADNFTLSDMYIDGGSSRFAAQIIDTDANGTPDCAINSNASTTSCNVGASTWCPADWHDVISTGGAVNGITLERLHIINSDRRTVQIIAGVGSTVRIRQNWFDGNGEHQMSINADSISITDNEFWNSSVFANAGLQLGPTTTQYAWHITGNRFRKWIGPALGSEGLGSGTPIEVSTVVVTGNTFYNDYTLTTSLAGGHAIDLNTGAEATYTMRRWNISGNTFEALEASDSAGAILVRAQNGATQGGRMLIANNVIKHDFQASATAKAVVTAAVPYTLIEGNIVEFDGDDTSGGATPETGIMMNGNCNSCAAIGNFVVATATGANGIAADSATQATIQSNHIDYTGITGGTNFAILVTNTSTDATVKANVLNCAASDTSTSMVRIQNTSENFVVNDNLMIEGANQVNVANALVGTVQNNRARGLSSYQVSRQAGQSHWESGNICFSCYQANGSNVDPDSIVANGETFIVDANGDGTFDAITYHVIYGDTQLRFPGQTDDAFEAYLTAREATADRTSTLSNATGQVPVFSSSTSVGILVWSAGTDTTLDTGTLVCADRDLVCIDVYTPAGDTTNTCASDFGSGVPFYAVCRGN